MTKAAVKIGDQVFAREDGEEFGAVRQVYPHELVVFIEGAGDFTIPSTAVSAVHDGKIIVDPAELPAAARMAIKTAHRKEESGK
jgi:hypothetical protein